MNLKIIKNHEHISKEKALLICFSYAGGGASAYSRWQRLIGDEIVVCQVQLPGREERYNETPFTNIEECVEQIVEAVSSIWNQFSKICFFGHSMGAKVAYETAIALQNTGKKIDYLFISGSTSPNAIVKKKIAMLSDDAFIEELKKYEGTPKEILEQKEFVQFFLPTIRADFTMIEEYRDTKKQALDCPIWGFFGEFDSIVGIAQDADWNAYSNVEFKQFIYNGSHFFIRDYEGEIVSKIGDQIASL